MSGASPRRIHVAFAALLPALIAWALAWLIERRTPELYYRLVQEDEALEWMTFWCFVFAAWMFGREVVARHRASLAPRLLWFPAGLSVFCLLVGMEEISWGQRLLGYRAPAYFLEHNFQQELNLHNIVQADFRKLGFLLVALGYGVALPFVGQLVGRIPRLGALLHRTGIQAPPLEVVAPFASAGILYLAYPWKFTGEWTELILGTAFFATALLQRNVGQALDEAGPASIRPGAVRALALGFGGALIAGLVSAEVMFLVQRDSPERQRAAEVEIAALAEDFRHARTRTRCGLHKRVYTYATRYGAGALRSGVFSELAASGLPTERAEFFLDPWNSPYWIRHMCNSSRTRRVVFVYSFGPDRRRDSSRWALEGDDVGVYVKGEAVALEASGDE
jgi:hypothetical protein